MEARNILHSGYFNDTLRKWQSTNTEITGNNLMYPIFIIDSKEEKEEIPSMPEVFRFGVNRLREFLDPLMQLGLKSVLLFGVLKNLDKDELATNADSAKSPVIQAIPLLKSWYPNLTIACDICLCGYTSHGHCGILNSDGSINNRESILRLGSVAQSYALAGADIVAPSDMMDGRVASIKAALVQVNLSGRVAVLSYSAKFSSCLYGPFRDAANSAPGFGDRKRYQLPPGSKGLSLLAVQRDIREGCDMIMVKPAMFYLDIIQQAKTSFPEYPLFAYQVSGEYSMLHHAANAGAFNLRTAVEESLTSIRRAGADVIITYFTPKILKWISE